MSQLKLHDAAQFMLETAQKLGATQADVLAGRSESSSMMAFGGQIQSTEMSISQGIGIRLFMDHLPGYSFCEKLSKEAIEQAVKDAIDQTYLTQALHLQLPEPSLSSIEPVDEYDPIYEQLGFEELGKNCLALEKQVLEAHPQVVNIPHLGIEKSKSESILLNSKGFFEADSQTHWGVGLGVVSALGEVRKMGVASEGSHFYHKLNFEKLGQKALERSLELLDAKPITSGQYPLLISKRVAGSFFSLFGSIFSADQVHKGLSRLAGQKDQQIASSCLTLTNDPWRRDLPGFRRWDSEGVLSSPFALIENGILKNYLYNLETAQKEGIPSNGCAQRSYSGRVGVGFANLIVNTGTQSHSEIAAQFPKFLEIVKLEGSTGCSAVSGQISVGIQGFLWENGQRAQAVDRVTISGDFFDWIQRIVAVGNEYEDQWSSVKIPDLWIESVIVAS